MRHRSARLLVVALSLTTSCAHAPAAAGGEVDWDEVTLRELREGAERETSVASSRVRRLRQTPAVVTILTRDDLVASGARDLAEALMLVPGFQLGLDAANGAGVGVRGLWGHEGKVLFLLDGFTLNDLSYGIYQVGRRLPIDQLDRIEVIRGPGSAQYGGQAQLAVVSVVTRTVDVDGVAASLAGGRLARATSLAQVTAAAGGPAGPVRLSAVGAFSAGVRSDRRYADLAGAGVDLARDSGIRAGLLSLRLDWEHLELRALYDDEAIATRDGYADVLPRAVDVRWRTAALEARLAFPWRWGTTVHSRLGFKVDQPWRALEPDLPDVAYDATNQRLEARLWLEADALAGPTLMGGVEAWVERGTRYAVAPGDSRLEHESVDVAAFTELAYDGEWANVLGGLRFESNSASGRSFVPRLALTRMLGPWHVKLLAAGAFRAPAIENLNAAAERLRAEETRDYEIEVGLQLSRALYVVVNAFDVSLLHPIVYSFSGADAYANGPQTGSRGLEAVLNVRHGPAAGELSWSWYDARGRNRVPAYAVAGDASRLVGFAGHKVVVATRLRPWRHLLLAPTLTWLSRRGAFDGSEAPDQPAAGGVQAGGWLDLTVSLDELGVPGLSLDGGVRDLLDRGGALLQPYPGGHAPLPLPGREAWLRLRWEG